MNQIFIGVVLGLLLGIPTGWLIAIWAKWEVMKGDGLDGKEWSKRPRRVVV